MVTFTSVPLLLIRELLKSAAILDKGISVVSMAVNPPNAYEPLLENRVRGGDDPGGYLGNM